MATLWYCVCAFMCVTTEYCIAQNSAGGIATLANLGELTPFVNILPSHIHSVNIFLICFSITKMISYSVCQPLALLNSLQSVKK